MRDDVAHVWKIEYFCPAIWWQVGAGNLLPRAQKLSDWVILHAGGGRGRRGR